MYWGGAETPDWVDWVGVKRSEERMGKTSGRTGRREAILRMFGAQSLAGSWWVWRVVEP
jgi:hypothetical protein